MFPHIVVSYAAWFYTRMVILGLASAAGGVLYNRWWIERVAKPALKAEFIRQLHLEVYGREPIIFKPEKRK